MDHVADFSIQLVQDFLIKKGFTESATVFQKELKQLNLVPTSAAWVDMYAKCNLASSSHGTGSPSSLESLVEIGSTQAALLSSPLHEPGAVNVFASSNRNAKARLPEQQSVSGGENTSQRAAKTTMYAAAYRSRITRPSVRERQQQDTQEKQQRQAHQLFKSKSLPPEPSRKKKLGLKTTTTLPASGSTVAASMAPTMINLSPIKTVMSKETKACLDKTTYFVRKELMEHRRKEQEDLKKVASQHLNRPQIVQKDKFKACSLCQQTLPIQHLPFQISYKGIMDLHEKWGYVDPNPNNSRAKPPLCYDRVQVCLFCAQLLQDSDSYRAEPTNWRKNKSNKKKHAVAQSDKLVTDPLALPPLEPEDCNDMTLASMDQTALRRIRRESMCPTGEELEHWESKVSRLLYVEETLNSETKMSADEWNIIKQEDDEENSSLMKTLRHTMK